jgi:bifunctional DNA-binding transcriptional regulator/antitoxin component of YhaV-PrlF toxin-antitoxin module
MGGRGEAKAKKAVKEVKVGKRGSIIIPAEMVAVLGIRAEDRFTVRKSKSGAAFKRVGAEE